MRAVFPQVGIFDVPQTENAVMVATNSAAPTFESMLRNRNRSTFNETFRRVINADMAAKLFRVAESNKKAPLLTDDFAPTEFLNATKPKRSDR